MRKILLSIVITLLLFFGLSLSNLPKAQAQEEVFNQEYYEDVTSETFQSNIKNFTMYDDHSYNLDGYSYYEGTDIKIYVQTLNYFILENDLYILYYNGNYCLEKHDITTKEMTRIRFNHEVCNMKLVDDLIYIVGTKERDAIFYTYNLDLQMNYQYQYGGDNYEKFTDIYLLNDKIYLFGQKNGISNHSPFANVGSNTDLKSFVVSLDENFHIDKGFYINEHCQSETFEQIIVNNQSFYFIIKDEDNNFYQYHLNANLELLERYQINEYLTAEKFLLVDAPNMANEKLYIYFANNNIYYAIFTNEVEHNFQIATNVKKLLYSYLDQGSLIIYYQVDHDIIKTILTMHYIIEIKEKEVSYKDQSYLDTSHFKVSSYLEDLTFTYDQSLNENIILNKSGRYEASYSAQTTSGKKITIKTPYIIKPYINIIDGGIYPLNYILEFTDDVYLNDQKIHVGEVLNKTGELTLKHQTSEGIEEYHIRVVDRYYKNLEINNQEEMILQNKQDIYQYSFYLTTFKKVKAVYVNDIPYSFKQNKEQISLDFINKTYGINHYKINYVVFEDDSTLSINEEFKIKTLKTKPIVDAYYMDEAFNFQIIDDDRTINDIVVKYYQNHTLVKTISSLLQPLQLKTLNEIDEIEVVLQYEIGTKDIYELTLLDLQDLNINKISDLFEIDVAFDNNQVTNIKISKPLTKNTKINNATVLDLKITDSLNSHQSYLYLYICLGLAIIFLVIAIIILIFKRKKVSHNH